MLVVGDAGWDLYWVGSPKGLSAEAPIPVLTHERVLTLPGMAANVASLLKQLGCEVTLVTGPQHPIKNRLVTTEGVQLARWDVGDWCTPLQVTGLRAVVEEQAPTAVLVSDYSKGTITPDVITYLVALADGGTPIYVDTKNDPARWLGDAITLFPNQLELAQWAEHYTWMPQVVAKQGAAGASLVAYGVVRAHTAAPMVQAQNVCGAGDALITTYLAASLTGRTPIEALEEAVFAASSYVSRPFFDRRVEWAPRVQNAEG